MDIRNEIIELCRKEATAGELRRCATQLERHYRQRRLALLEVLDNKEARRARAGKGREVKRNTTILHGEAQKSKSGGAK